MSSHTAGNDGQGDGVDWWTPDEDEPSPGGASARPHDSPDSGADADADPSDAPAPSDEPTVFTPPKPALADEPTMVSQSGRTSVEGEPSQAGAGTPPPLAAAPRTRSDAPRVPLGRLDPGFEVEGYVIDRLLRDGGLSAVYLAHNKSFVSEQVVIKTIRPDTEHGAGTHATAQARFQTQLEREAGALKSLWFEEIAHYLKYGEVPGTDGFYLAIEYIEGPTLQDYLNKTRKPLSERHVIALGIRLATGLHNAHSKTVVHRDIAPDNIILSDGDILEAKLIDFGIARTDSEDEFVGDGFAGKISYAAPEQLDGSRRISTWTDVYSLALTLATAARGAKLDMGTDIESARARRTTVPDLSTVPPALAGVLEQMLQPNIRDRVQNMRRVIRLLEGAQNQVGSGNYRAPAVSLESAPVRRFEDEAKPSQRPNRPWLKPLAWVGAGIAATALVVAIGFWLRAPVSDAPPAPPPSTVAEAPAPPPSPAPPVVAPVTPPSPPPPEPAPPPPPDAATFAETLQAALMNQPCTLIAVMADGTNGVRAHGYAGDPAAIRALPAARPPAGLEVSWLLEEPGASLCPVTEALRPLVAAGASVEPGLIKVVVQRYKDTSIADYDWTFSFGLDASFEQNILHVVELSNGSTKLWAGLNLAFFSAMAEDPANRDILKLSPERVSYSEATIGDIKYGGILLLTAGAVPQLKGAPYIVAPDADPPADTTVAEFGEIISELAGNSTSQVKISIGQIPRTQN